MLQPSPRREGSEPAGASNRIVAGAAPRRWFRRRRLWAGLLGAAVLIAAGGALVGQRRTASQQRSLATYTVVAREGALPGVITASGELGAYRRVNVSPKRQGVLQQLYVDEGDRVQAGQPIALMDSGDLSDRLQELQAQLESAQALLARSRSELQRNEGLIRQKAISQNDFNRIRSTYLVDLASARAAQQRLEQRQMERSELTVRAPFSGVITARFADPGAYVTPTTSASASAGASSSSVVELAQGLEAIAKVPESDIGRLKVGQAASVRVDAFPDRRFAAQVRQIAPRAEKLNNVTSFEVKLRMLNPPPELRIGMTADIDFNTGALAARTLVPTVAVVTEDGRPGVLLVGKGNQPTFQPVSLGASSGRDTQILSGLRPGTRVFIDLPPWAKKTRGKD
ncbi:MAG: efflux RND transporter periplasmic adaptor subunit [Synechococcaceae bacterium WB8_1B_136]|nr:efflux RND transporter periplasmic adaptor subunit [Synechococcaceae bacterium WB8_1B_136]